METPYTDENRINEIQQNVDAYLAWVSRFEGNYSKEREVPLKEWIGPREVRMQGQVR
jgi:hypothetical protein